MPRYWRLIRRVAERLESLGRTEEAKRWRALSLEGRAWSAVAGLERGHAAGPRLERVRSDFAELSPSVVREVARPIRWLAARLDSIGQPELAARWRSLLPE